MLLIASCGQARAGPPGATAGNLPRRVFACNCMYFRRGVGTATGLRIGPEHIFVGAKVHALTRMFIFPQSCLEYAVVADDSRASFTAPFQGTLMPRPIFAFAALLIGSVLPAAQALAQYYPPQVYRGAPPADQDDDDLFADQPGDYRVGPRQYPTVPREQAPYDQRRIPADRYGRYDDQVEVLRPPVGIYPEDQPVRVIPAPRYVRPQYPGYPPQDYPGPQPGYGPPPGYGSQQTYGTPPNTATQPGSVTPPMDLSGRGVPTSQPPTAAGRTDQTYAALPPDYQPEEGNVKELPAQLRRQMVAYRTKEPAGTIVVDTANTYLYFVLGNGQAIRYGIGVGREGFTWAGEERISRMSQWPDWHPPADMIERQPYLPRFMAGGASNPLGARALYLGKSLYRIHGTNQPSTIGQFVSSGCIRLLNEDIEDLYGRVNVGTRVVVLRGKPPATAER